MKMRFFNCLVKLGGDPVLMQTPRMYVSEHELKVLRHLHGDDAISQLNQVAEQEVAQAEHLYQLARMYQNKKMVEELFRVTLDNFDAWLENAVADEEMLREQREQERLMRESNKSSKPQLSNATTSMMVDAAKSQPAQPVVDKGPVPIGEAAEKIMQEQAGGQEKQRVRAEVD